jgi:hypothetical protein
MRVHSICTLFFSFIFLVFIDVKIHFGFWIQKKSTKKRGKKTFQFLSSIFLYLISRNSFLVLIRIFYSEKIPNLKFNFFLQFIFDFQLFYSFRFFLNEIFIENS